MKNKEIIIGLMIKLAAENINVISLSKRVGYKNYLKFEKALKEAFKIIEHEKLEK